MSANWSAPGAERVPLPTRDARSSHPSSVRESGLRLKEESIRSIDPTADEIAAFEALEARLGQLHVRQRLGLERDYEAHISRQGTHSFQIENWRSSRSVGVSGSPAYMRAAVVMRSRSS